MKVGIIGCGVIAQAHLAAVRRHPDAEVVGLADPDATALEETAAKFGVSNRYSDVPSLIEKARPDVVHVLTPTHLHLSNARVALEGGCHVYVEKPLGVNAAQAEELLALAEQKGLKLCVGHNFLFDPVVTRARKLAESGQLGPLCGIESYFGGDLGTAPQSRYYRQAYTHWAFGMPGGLLQNILDHPLSVVIPFMDDPKDVHALAGDVGVVPAGLPGELRLIVGDGKVVAHVTASFAATPRAQSLRLLGSHGSVHVDIVNQRLLHLKHIPKVPHFVTRAWMNLSEGFGVLGGTIRNVLKVLTGRFTPFEGMERLLAEFYRSIENGDPSPVSPEHTLRVARIMDTVWEQLREQGFGGPGLRKPSPSVLHAERGGPSPRTLVTGATGFIGSRLVRALTSRDDSGVRAFVRNTNKMAQFKDLPVEATWGDLRNEESVAEATSGVEVIYHLGAAMGGDWDTYMDVSVRGTERLLQAALKQEVKRLVYVSSIAVYGLPPQGTVVTEQTPFDESLVGYAKSKIETEKLVMRYVKEEGLPAVILRPGVVYGQDHGISRLGYPFGRYYVLIGLNDNKLPTVWVEDVVQALILAGTSPEAVGQVYNVVANPGLKKTQYLKLLGEHGPAPTHYIRFPFTLASAAGGVARLLSGPIKPMSRIAALLSPSHLNSCVRQLTYDSSKLQNELGWSPDTDLGAHFRSDASHR